MSLENVTYMLMVHPGWSLGPSFMTDLQYRHRVNIKIVTDGMATPIVIENNMVRQIILVGMHPPINLRYEFTYAYKLDAEC